jgi:hypothetical protein
LINSIFYPKSKVHLSIWFFFHVLLGLISVFNVLILISWFYYVLVIQLNRIFRSSDKSTKINNLTYLLVYLAPFEMVCRMANTSPIIPFELGKYLTFFLLIIGIQIQKNYPSLGIVILLLLVPGILMGWNGSTDYRLIIFNVMGLINLALGIIFFSGRTREIRTINIDYVVRLLLYPLITAMIFVFLKTPNYDEIDFQLNANVETSGGFGSNQVSTAFGLGMLMIFYLWIKGISFTGISKLLDIGIVGLFFFQGLLTFSRGGIIGGLFGILLLLISIIKQKRSNIIINRVSKLFLLGFPLILILAISANEITSGRLLMRYQGETAGTLAGAKEKSVNTLTSGRFEIFLGDIEIFKENLVLGVGVNQSRYIRKYSTNVVAHVELSRLLSEHGLLGLIIFCIFLYYLLIKLNLLSSEFAILYILFVVGFYTTFHAATRTFISPLIMSLSFLPTTSVKVKV